MKTGKNEKIIGPEMHECDECGRRFKFKSHLKSHEYDHKRLSRQAKKQNAKKAPKPADKEKYVSETHECNECTKKFKTKVGIHRPKKLMPRYRVS